MDFLWNKYKFGKGDYRTFTFLAPADDLGKHTGTSAWASSSTLIRCNLTSDQLHFETVESDDRWTERLELVRLEFTCCLPAVFYSPVLSQRHRSQIWEVTQAVHPHR